MNTYVPISSPTATSRGFKKIVLIMITDKTDINNPVE